MLKTNTSVIEKAQTSIEPLQLTNSVVELVNWSALSSKPTSSVVQIADKVLALQTNRGRTASSSLSNKQALATEEKSAFDSFNLGLHVGDVRERVTSNREQLREYISQQLPTNKTAPTAGIDESIKIQWLEQVHGNEVVEVTSFSDTQMTAHASITRQKNIALAIMTADCLPILLTNCQGTEIAAIHGGWRPLAADIIKQTLHKMTSKSSEVFAWLGPCIGENAFEVGSEVRDNFLKQNQLFDGAFVKQQNGKYLADLHFIAQLQLRALGVTSIANLAECTFQNTEKYYSYRKEQITGRMATIICRK